mmetsp:Transcript_26030/g.39406  ORF Transcript_26030/g.39406 Transcript_26030/m.39406 type:complete len:275 (+) Transcript_26030:83-907(+)|eukprot:CAMPEP_0178922330 /NCGR_PEP_ID=MMETSP0786-20121207/16090_1 /TAXON_ID=186022 /ORGANISM="Thalassionema frauenfeldii, Strain CCMP 1798" /LENGTH=274 /DNA_ID=CAMNT_0020596675 /DNA_START=68 /DNA_END=892 /DNA_ORIENTATION=+
MVSLRFTLLVLLSQFGIPYGFNHHNNQVEHRRHCGPVTARRSSDNEDSTASVRRRNVLFNFLLATSSLSVYPSTADAKDEIFKPNPLTNKALEQIRIWDQNYADDIKYGGELENGDAYRQSSEDTYVNLLVPIVGMSNDITQINELVGGSDIASWQQALEIVASPKFQKINFKKIFNAYSDNIYYKDPDRANLYLGGGATPKNEQSIAYLQRNEILTNLESLQAELEYLLRPNTPSDESPDDLRLYAHLARTAMDNYLAVVPPSELQKAIKFSN